MKFYKVTILTIFFAVAAIVQCDREALHNKETIPAVDARFSPLLGAKIPDYELDAYQSGRMFRVNLKDYRGKWLILFFYPSDFTFVCPTELRDMAALYKEFKEAGAEVLAVSTDSVYTHKAWHEQNKDVNTVKFPMLSDRPGRLSRALGTYVEEKGYSVRASFIADPAGKIVAYEVHDDTIGRSASELIRKLDAIIAVRASDGSFCPANWRQGDKLIKAE